MNCRWFCQKVAVQTKCRNATVRGKRISLLPLPFVPLLVKPPARCSLLAPSPLDVPVTLLPPRCRLPLIQPGRIRDKTRSRATAPDLENNDETVEHIVRQNWEKKSTKIKANPFPLLIEFQHSCHPVGDAHNTRDDW